MNEIWKDIINYEGLYQVSNLGSVRRLWKNKSKPIALAKHKQGYVTVHLSNINKKRHSVHRLVAIAFIPNPLNLPEVNHKNGIKNDNREENLEWSTDKQNKEHAKNNNLTAKGIKNRNNKFSEKEILAIRMLYKKGWTQVEIGKMCDTRQSTISAIVLNKTWKHI